MKLTPELIGRSESSLNTLQDRELDLRGHKIPAIENLGVTRDQNDAIDLTDNDIRALANFPNLKRLHTLVVANNVISRIDRRLANALPRLTTLVLTNNALEDVAALDPLARFPLLEYVSLMGNPVARKQHYREYVVWKCKSLRVLDFQRITQTERVRARQLMETSDGRPSALAASLSSSGSRPSEEVAQATAGNFERQPKKPRTFDVGSTASVPAAGRRMTAEERKALEDAIDKSSSLEEIRQLEERLRLGYMAGA